jgi:hypothetical protein
MSQDLEVFGEMNDAEALEEAESGDGGVEVQTGGKTCAENETECFERVHGCNKNDATNRRQISKYHESAWTGERTKCLRAKTGVGGLDCSGTSDHTLCVEWADDDCRAKLD